MAKCTFASLEMKIIVRLDESESNSRNTITDHDLANACSAAQDFLDANHHEACTAYDPCEISGTVFSVSYITRAEYQNL